ncbi:hypothetical protein ACHAQA_004809 [Verticillium albo-atrum]
MSTTAPSAPRVGVAAIVTNAQGQVVCGKRKGSHGADTWQLPGGHLEYGESFVECAQRETLEETGLRVRGVKVVAVGNDVFEAAKKHYITIFVQCVMEDATATPQAMEREKCSAWFWKSWDELRQLQDSGENLFLPLVNLFREHANIDALLSAP